MAKKKATELTEPVNQNEVLAKELIALVKVTANCMRKLDHVMDLVIEHGTRGRQGEDQRPMSQQLLNLWDQVRHHHSACGCGACCALSGWGIEDEVNALENPPPALTKADFVRRYQRGEFGNASPTWNSYSDWRHDWQPDGWEDRPYHIRAMVAGAPTFYNVPGYRVEDAWKQAKKVGVDYYISEMAPTEKTLFQGEVRRSINHVDLYYSLLRLPMRDALHRGGRHANGLVAVCLLRSFLCPASYDWLQHLLDRYVGHTVEFSTYEVNWGTLPGYNTVFWEVRNY